MDDKYIQFEKAYWNKHAEMISPPSQNGKRKFMDNWWKRQKMIQYLLDYDFEESSVLEIGCGAGFTAFTLLSLYGGTFKYLGVDVSDKFVEVAKTIFGLSAMVARTSELPLDSQSFDNCFAFDVLEHICLGDRAQTALQLNRVLKPKARIFINNPFTSNPCGHDERVEHGFDNIDMMGLSATLGMGIERVETYGIRHGNRYQFIVMSRS
jgi:SAM-dependent methyltransferase